MNKYLIEILKIQKSVILPGLGALMVPSQKSGKIVFNPHLKFNDGSLAKYIAEKEGIDNQEAQNKVAKFVREIEAELGKGNTYDMFEFGHFYKNKDGETDFNMADDAAALKAELNASTSKAEAPKKTESSKKTEKKEDKKPPVEANKEASAPTPVVSSSDEKSITEKAKEKAAAIEAEAVKESEITKAAVDKKLEEAKKAAEEKAKAAEKEAAEAAKKAQEKAKKEAKAIEAGALKVNEKAKKEAEAIEEEALKANEKAKKSIGAIISGKGEDEQETSKQRKNTYVPADKSEGEEKTKAFAPVKPDPQEKGPDDKIPPLVASGAAVDKATAPIEPNEKVVIVEEKKKKSRLPWIILLLLIVGLAVTGFFFRDKIESYLGGEGSAEILNTTDDDGSTEEPIESILTADSLSGEMLDGEISMDDPQGDSSMTETTMDTETNENSTTPDAVEEDEPVTSSPPPATSGTNNGNYHLIGNSFSEKANAERYVSTMKNKGYPAKVLGRFDGLYLVSLKSYDSRSAANSGRSSVTADASSAWVFKY